MVVKTDVFLLLQVSALLGRIPSAVGYQPTLATDMGTMQERITTTKKGSITSVQVKIKTLFTQVDKIKPNEDLFSARPSTCLLMI